ncbi:MAG: glucose-1-phosphate thymidylyltransferase RfbA [Deltaproteobacteria bacterium]|nr:glucose-1-phosphate thymidylyltransferase RfbA [Deltaproteobacteria bacterium]
MKGIVLAGGYGTRLKPASLAVIKQLMPVYNKPMIFYPLSTLMLTGIRDILIISTPNDTPKFKQLFGDGKRLGVRFFYKVQKTPKGIAEALIIGKEFIKNDSVVLILGDNIFYGANLEELLISAKESVEQRGGAYLFCYRVKDPTRYGIARFDNNMRLIEIIEKPKDPPSNWAVTGIYFYDSTCVEIASSLRPSKRGELEITDINNWYIKKKSVSYSLLGSGYAWLDMGTFQSMLDAQNFIETIETRQGLKIGSVEEIAYRKGYIKKEGLRYFIELYKGSEYADYLQEILNEKD